MGRRATGSIVATPGDRGTAYAARFTAYGERRFVTLGNSADGCDQRKAETELDNIMADVRRGTWAPPAPEREVTPPTDEPTFHEFASEWFEANRGEWAENTATSYLWHLRDHLLPFFQHHRLSEITIVEVDRFRQAKVRERDAMLAARERGEQTEHRPLSNETINKFLVRLGQILEVAEERGLIPRNPMRVNSANRKLKVSRPSRSYLDSARQIAALLDAAGELDREARANHRHLARRAMFATLVFSGLRLGELLALRWRDVDLAGGWLHVGRSKTDGGVRRIKIRPALRDALAPLRPLDALPDALVFATASGKAHSQSNVRRTMSNVVERANERLQEAREAPLPRLSPHSLRRTFASVLFALGESLPTVMADGGWAEPKTPLTVYAHTMRRDDDENAALRALVDGAELPISAEKGRTAPAESIEATVESWAGNEETRS